MGFFPGTGSGGGGSGSASYSWGPIQTDLGTSPTPDVHGDVLSFTSADSSIAVSGDATTDTISLTLPTVNLNVGTFGSAGSVSQVTLNAKGQATAASNVAIQISEGQVTNLVSDLAGKQATGNYITALTGDVTAAGPGSAAATLASVGTAGTYVKVTTDAKGRVTSGSTSPQAIADGGTGQTTQTAAFDALSPMTTQYDLILGGASGTGTRLAKGANGTHLTTIGGVVAWTVDPTPYVVNTISSNTTAVSGNTYLCDTSGGAFNLTLPTPVANAFITIKDKTGSFQTNNLTVVQAGSEKIEGLAASKVLQTPWGAFSLFSDGTDWYMGAI